MYLFELMFLVIFGYTYPGVKLLDHMVIWFFSSVQLLSRVWLCDPMDYSMPGFPVHYQLLELAQIHVHRVGDISNHLILCRPVFLLPSIFPASGSFLNESVLRMRWPKCWSFSFSISPSSEYWFALGLAGLFLQSKGCSRVSPNTTVQQHPILWCSAFFMVQLSHPYMTTGKIIALTRWTFVGKVMSLLFNMLSRLVIDFLPRNKHLLISWPQSPSAVILEPKQIKPVTVSIVSSSICHEMMGPDAMIDRKSVV